MTDPKLNGAASRDDGVAVLVMVGARWMVGLISKAQDDAWDVMLPPQIDLYSPYEYQGAVQVQKSATVRGAVDLAMPKMCAPLGGLPSIRSLPVRPDAMKRIAELGKRDREGVMRAIAQCDEIVAEIRRNDGGIAKPRLIVPGS
jgi:hypothetical protein